MPAGAWLAVLLESVDPASLTAWDLPAYLQAWDKGKSYTVTPYDYRLDEGHSGEQS